MIEGGRCFWVDIGEHVRMGLCLSWWKPWDKIKLSRSISIKRFYNAEIPFIYIDISVICVELEWMLYII